MLGHKKICLRESQCKNLDICENSNQKIQLAKRHPIAKTHTISIKDEHGDMENMVMKKEKKGLKTTFNPLDKGLKTTIEIRKGRKTHVDLPPDVETDLLKKKEK